MYILNQGHNIAHSEKLSHHGVIMIHVFYVAVAHHFCRFCVCFGQKKKTIFFFKNPSVEILYHFLIIIWILLTHTIHLNPADL